MKRKAAYLIEKAKIEIAEDCLPPLKADEVLIKVHSIGICGSDVSYYTKGATGLGALSFPHILGHECAGEVADVGEAAAGFAVGDRVAVEPGVPCGSCEYCRTGRYNLCESMAFMSSAIKRPGGEGGMATYIIRPAAYVYALPESVTYDEGALLEPVSVALHAVRRSGIKAGQKAAVLGCGPIAGCLLMVLRAWGVTDVFMTDMVETRVKFMKELGARSVLLTENVPEEEVRGWLQNEVHVVFDTTCNEDAINHSLPWLRKGGAVVLVGVFAEHKRIDMKTLFAKELSMITTFRYANTYPQAISLVESGKIKPELLISKHYFFEDADEAMKKASYEKNSVMKVMLKCQ